METYVAFLNRLNKSAEIKANNFIQLGYAAQAFATQLEQAIGAPSEAISYGATHEIDGQSTFISQSVYPTSEDLQDVEFAMMISFPVSGKVQTFGVPVKASAAKSGIFMTVEGGSPTRVDAGDPESFSPCVSDVHSALAKWVNEFTELADGPSDLELARRRSLAASRQKILEGLGDE